MRTHLYEFGVRKTLCGIAFIKCGGIFVTKVRRKPIQLKPLHLIGDGTCNNCFKVMCS